MKSLKKYDVIIIGAGAAGLMCAALLPKNLKILIIEANSTIGAKIKISGGGNCNITNENVTCEDFLGDKEFMQTTFDTFIYKDILHFFDGVLFEKRKKAQFFSKTGSGAVIEHLRKCTSHCEFAFHHKCLHVNKSEELFTWKCDKATFLSRVCIVASGGLSYPKLGSSSIGYEIAKSFGHKVQTTSPALVGFTVQKEEFWAKKLSGISLHVNLQIGDKNFEDDLLFSHKGFSGPAVLNASLFWQKGSITIDFMPQKQLKNLLKKESKKQLSSILPLPKRFIKEFLQAINLQDKPIYKLTNNEIEILHKKLHTYTFSPVGTFGYTKAEVTKGGVCTDEINPLTYESTKVKNLFFIGEVLDITGRLGGFNFTFAFMSAMMMAKNFQFNKK